ncbi:MAG: glycosyltransferase family 2 protein, partial [Ornithinimicrobium sp.]
MMASSVSWVPQDLPGTPAAWILSGIILIGALPMISSVVGYVLVALHGRRDHYALADPLHEPRVAVLVPAWNEAPVLEFSVDRMMQLDYPSSKLRMVVVDDAST